MTTSIVVCTLALLLADSYNLCALYTITAVIMATAVTIIKEAIACHIIIFSVNHANQAILPDNYIKLQGNMREGTCTIIKFESENIITMMYSLFCKQLFILHVLLKNFHTHLLALGNESGYTFVKNVDDLEDSLLMPASGTALPPSESNSSLCPL